MRSNQEELDLAVTWFVAARAMTAARGGLVFPGDSAPGVYAQSLLGIGEQTCLDAKSPEQIYQTTLVDCLSAVGRLDDETAEKIVTGVLMIALIDGQMEPLEIRWASMLASAAGLSEDRFQQCCAGARVIATMIRPAVGEAAS